MQRELAAGSLSALRELAEGLTVINEFYGLTLDPFRPGPDARFCYRHRSFTKAKAYMRYALHRGEGFVMVTGQPGIGKTTLIEDLLSQTATSSVKVARITSTQVVGDDLLHLLANAFGIDTQSMTKSMVLLNLRSLLKQQMHQGGSSLLIVDEAHNLSFEFMEELCMITNLQEGASSLLQVVLVGQDRLRSIIAQPRLEQLQQRILAACLMEPLNPEETRDYLHHRLRCAGWGGSPTMSGEAVWLLHSASGGVPQAINVIANRLLFFGCIEEKEHLDADDVRRVVRDLQDEPSFASGTSKKQALAEDAETTPTSDIRDLAITAPSPTETIEAPALAEMAASVVSAEPTVSEPVAALTPEMPTAATVESAPRTAPPSGTENNRDENRAPVELGLRPEPIDESVMPYLEHHNDADPEEPGIAEIGRPEGGESGAQTKPWKAVEPTSPELVSQETPAPPEPVAEQESALLGDAASVQAPEPAPSGTVQDRVEAYPTDLAASKVAPKPRRGAWVMPAVSLAILSILGILVVQPGPTIERLASLAEALRSKTAELWSFVTAPNAPNTGAAPSPAGTDLAEVREVDAVPSVESVPPGGPGGTADSARSTSSPSAPETKTNPRPESSPLLVKGTQSVLFPEPGALSPAVAFWSRVYTEVDSASGFVHDSEKPDLIYGTLYLNPDVPPSDQNRAIEKTLGEYRDALLKLASGDRHTPNAFENQAARAWSGQASEDELKAAAERLRFQRGQSDRILAGLSRYARWKAKIQAILQGHGLPPALAALPLVESSYDPRAVSKAGAVGLWQLMPTTARRYLRVDDEIDERLDPTKSSEAAALVLLHNYSVLKSWPLALTAYNHGLSGVRRAVRETGTDDLSEIVKAYVTERFGFASRNFYAAFLAGLKILSHPDRYFPDYRQEAEERIALVTPAYLPVDVLVEGFGIEKKRLRTLNPSLHHAVWNGDQLVPEGYSLQLPESHGPSWAEDRLAKLAKHFGFSSQIPAPHYEVRLGDSLSKIAETYETTVAKLVAMNHLDGPDDIDAGQILRVPMTSDPKPMGAGSAAILAAQRAGDDSDGGSLDLPHLVIALVGQEGDVDHDAPRESLQAPHASDACRYKVTDEPAHNPTDSNKRSAETATTFAEAQKDRTADPLDYSVAADGTIEIQASETLGHYADWLQLEPERINSLNNLDGKSPLIVGHRLRLDFSNTSIGLFETKRISFHKSLQLRYLNRHRIKGVIKHKIIAGDSLWLLAVDQYDVPLWLLRQYNPDIGGDTPLSVGSLMFVPDVEILPDEPDCSLPQISSTAPAKDPSSVQPTSTNDAR